MLTQRMLQRIGAISMKALGERVETITYRARATADAAPVVYILAVQLEQYRVYEIDHMVILKEDLRVRLPVASVTWKPTGYDDFTRDDNTVWKIMNPYDGRNRVWWFEQARRVG